jgi:hypothetical protein
VRGFKLKELLAPLLSMDAGQPATIPVAEGARGRRNGEFWLRWLSLAVLYFIVAAAAHAGIFAKWAFRDHDADTSRLSLIRILDGTADRPFVYRQLLPMIANGLDEIVPERLKRAAARLDSGQHLGSQFSHATDSANPVYEFRYDVVYSLTFMSLFLSLFFLRAVCLRLMANRIGATLAPPAFALFLPLLMTGGGYFYDLPELLLFAAAAWACVYRCAYLLPALTLLGTLNKESFLLFVPTLFPLLRMAYAPRWSTLMLLGCATLSGSLGLLVKWVYRLSPGMAMENHLRENFFYYLNPRSYLGFELNYGILSPEGISLISVALVLTVFLLGWRGMPASARQSLKIAAVINAPFFLVFCSGGELRNLSLCYVGFVCLICSALNSSLSSGPVATASTGR